MNSLPHRAACWRATLTILLPCFLAVPWSRAADANPPERMSYQGFLADANGVVLGNDSPRNYTAFFRIYTAATGGVALWAEQQTITVDKGYFSVLLGEGSVVGSEPHANLSGIFTGSSASERYIGITVRGLSTTDVEIAPRLQLLAAPYSFLARNAVSLVNDQGAPFVNITSGTLAAIGIGAPIQSTGSGGNARGGKAVDLQLTRDNNTQVAGGEYSTIAGGRKNTASAVNSTVGGGDMNRATGLTSTVSGGFNNQATATESFIGGGVGNTASGDKSTVAGGNGNTASGPRAFVGGGEGNTASGDRSVVPGGLSNTAAGEYSFAAGRRAKANHHGSFIWADNTDTDYGSGAANQFRVRATGGTAISGAPARNLASAKQLLVTDTDQGVGSGTGLRLGFHHVPNVYWSGVIQSVGGDAPTELRLNPSGGRVVVGSGGLQVDGPITGGGSIPIGGIIMWSGAINAIPTGWRLCDGGGGTPDLRNRFIVGAGSSYNPGNTGGRDQVTLSVNNLPAHSHRISDLDRTGNPDGWRDGGRHYWRNASYQGHTDMGKETDVTGGNQAFDIRPPFYALAFIMRTQ
ncbi:MAG: hypothetical protein FJ398_21625 [Verrucomicrobia bacterium]|nr:hypothetical protein [Verrucomicrobiota bacterium]